MPEEALDYLYNESISSAFLSMRLGASVRKKHQNSKPKKAYQTTKKRSYPKNNLSRPRLNSNSL